MNEYFNKKKINKDGLESLVQVKVINLAGNLIDNLNEFSKLKDLSSLNQLILTDSSILATNPVCQKVPNYKQHLTGILPNLEYIDGTQS